MRKKFKRFLCITLSVMMAVLGSYPGVDVNAGQSFSSITSQSIKDKQNQIKESQALSKKLKNNITDAQKVKKELEALKKDVTAYITKIDKELAAIEDYIEELKQLILDKEEEIEIVTGELEEAIRVEENQYEAMKKRIKFIYEKGDSLYIDIMLNANGFGDFLTKADYIEMLSAYDRKKLEEYKDTREWTEICKQTLEAEKEALDEAKAAQEAEEASLQELHAEKEKELADYNASILKKEKQIANYEADLEEQTDAIEALEALILAEQKEIAARKGVVLTYDGGKFTWPCPSYTRVTDEFGWRVHPITKKNQFHKGVDLGAASGSSILAAYDGVIVAAAYDWSMGNYVMISHGSGLFTIYMHCSKLLCKVDDVVARGEKIALVGSTGSSTGPHLHFGVKLNGEYVSPWNYLSKPKK